MSASWPPPHPPTMMPVMHVTVALHTTLVRVKSTSASSDSLKASASCTAFRVVLLQRLTKRWWSRCPYVFVRDRSLSAFKWYLGPHARGFSPRATTQFTRLKSFSFKKKIEKKDMHREDIYSCVVYVFFLFDRKGTTCHNSILWSAPSYFFRKEGWMQKKSIFVLVPGAFLRIFLYSDNTSGNTKHGILPNVSVLVIQHKIAEKAGWRGLCQVMIIHFHYWGFTCL